MGRWTRADAQTPLVRVFFGSFRPILHFFLRIHCTTKLLYNRSTKICRLNKFQFKQIKLKRYLCCCFVRVPGIWQQPTGGRTSATWRGYDVIRRYRKQYGGRSREVRVSDLSSRVSGAEASQGFHCANSILRHSVSNNHDQHQQAVVSPAQALLFHSSSLVSGCLLTVLTVPVTFRIKYKIATLTYDYEVLLFTQPTYLHLLAYFIIINHPGLFVQGNFLALTATKSEFGINVPSVIARLIIHPFSPKFGLIIQICPETHLSTLQGALIGLSV